MSKYLYSCEWPSGSDSDKNLKKLLYRVYKRFHYLVEFNPEFLKDADRQIYHNTRLNLILDLKYINRNKFRGSNYTRFWVHAVSEIKHIDMWDCTFTIRRMKM